MDELVVAGRVGEFVDHFLADLDPVGNLFGADARRHFLYRDRGHGIPLQPVCLHSAALR